MSQWEGDKEVGLSPGQTAGEVGGVYVVRPEGYSTGDVFEIDSPEQRALKKQILESGTAIHGTPGEYGRQVQYLQSLGIRVNTPDLINVAPLMDMPRLSGAATPKDFIARSREFKYKYPGYSPYVTIEGTTVFTKNSRPNEVYVPQFGKMIPAEEYWEEHPTPFMKAEKAFMKAEKEFSDKYKLKETVADAVKAFRHAQFLAEYDPKYKKYGGGQSKLGKASSEYAIGFTEELAEKPLTAAGNMAFALLVTKGAGGLASKIPALSTGLGAGKLASKINAVNVLGVSLAGMYGISVAERYVEAPNKAKFLGGLTSTELLPMAVGGYLGTRNLPKIPIKELKRAGEISYLKLVREGNILQAKTGREFERFLLDESAELLKRKKAYQKLIQIRKPEVAKKAEAVEVIRADIALEKQLKAEARIRQMSITNPKLNIKYKKTLEVLQHPETLQMPMIIALNIQKAEAILKPEAVAIQKSISGQRLQPIQIPKAITRVVPIQEPKAIQEAVAILKAEQKALQIEKAKEILRPKQKQRIERLNRKLPPTFLNKKFIEDIEELSERKRRTKWVWNVRNPVPTLEDLL